MTKLVRGEFLKIRTTNAWWLLTLGALAMLALALGFNMLMASVVSDGNGGVDAGGITGQELDIYLAANLFTSGQFFGLLFVMLLGILLVTNEFHHQTATSTFLAAPRRTPVVLAKLITAALSGVALWLISTAVNVPATLLFLPAVDVPSHFGEWPIYEAILLNLLAYALWGILGVGIGVLIRSQIAATVTAAAVYLIGTQAAGIVFQIVSSWLDQDWIAKLRVIVPSIASTLMVTGSDVPGELPQWVGAAVLVGYAVLTTVVGTMIIRSRDVS